MHRDRCVRESGVTSRYFYQQFRDRDALLRAMFTKISTTFP